MDSYRFDRWAATYDESALRPAYLAAHDAVLRTLPCGGTPLRVLDVGCGTGQLLASMAAALPCGSLLIGVDTSAGMLGTAQGRLDEIGRLVQAAAERLPFADATFDAVVSTASFRHWAEPVLGMGEIRRVLVDDGVAVVADLVGGPLTVADVMAAASLEVVAAAKMDGYGPIAIVDVAVGRRRHRTRWRAWTRRTALAEVGR